ncbi:hypothetical protein ABEG10_23165 [Burkholderia cenocepacia]|uniref:hypothetical protein n=1 Tax=Burkholderia cenocepacia TaxID=95486 RepID=UPI00209D4C73|nr:hypothetical protein [Burkholderia cenocepacia]MCO8325957.1 hypothetical protein [Burkholderia cenocepacia]MCO8333027.1 hypothetical protein [Burkholderia cenocepacia]MCO8340527.1 hypothetical protein [Burkholderia cenocepacia]MCO8347813.1 hypothetical protein [Burkholderia cenocepacia]MCO8360879.1 hypothetical protein [Burkholderia cenocepacia]
MIDQDKMRALAKRLREKQADCDESLQAAHAIYALLAALEVAEGDLEAAAADKRDAELWRKWCPYLNRINRKPFELARDCDAYALAQRQGEGS